MWCHGKKDSCGVMAKGTHVVTAKGKTCKLALFVNNKHYKLIMTFSWTFIHIKYSKIVCQDVKYMDDSTLWEVCDRIGCDSQIQTSADQASDWTKNNNMQTNTDKTTEMCVYFGYKRLQVKPIMMDGINIERAARTKLLRLMINDKLNWQDHVDLISKKAGQRIYFVCLLKCAG